MMSNISIELSPEEAKRFRIFMEHYRFFETLIDADVHLLEHPQYILYANKFRVLKGIEAKKSIYRVK